MDIDNELLRNLDRLHTTELGAVRIKRNLSLDIDNVMEWCKDKINSDNAVITRQGKNWYVNVDDCIITVNAYSFTVITAHKEKIKGKDNMKQKIDFSIVTACGECCRNCQKKLDGLCDGCIESDGYVPEWADSGRCKVHACARSHEVQFCGICAEFPCKDLQTIIHWNPDIIEHLSALAKQYNQKGIY